MDPITGAAQQGLLSANQSFDAASLRLVGAFAGGGADAAAAAVDQAASKAAFVAATDVLETSQDMYKALLDITV